MNGDYSIGMSKQGFIPLRGIRLPAGLRGDGRRAQAGALVVLQAWSRTVGPPLRGHARPCGWADGVLSIEVDDSRWRATLEGLEPTLRAEMNAWLGGEVVAHLRAHLRAGDV